MATEYVANVANLHRLMAAVEFEQGDPTGAVHRMAILKVAASSLLKNKSLPCLVGLAVYSLSFFYQLMEAALPSDEQGMPGQLFTDLALDSDTHDLLGGVVFTSAVGHVGTRTYTVFDLQILGHDIEEVLTGLATNVFAWSDNVPEGSTFTVTDTVVLERLRHLLPHTRAVLL